MTAPTYTWLRLVVNGPGHDPYAPEVADEWLPVLGPTALILLRYVHELGLSDQAHSYVTETIARDIGVIGNKVTLGLERLRRYRLASSNQERDALVWTVPDKVRHLTDSERDRILGKIRGGR